VRVQIKDNGKAFPVEARLSGRRKKRLGLLGMQERVRLLNGRFAVRSAPGKGTTVWAEIPLKMGGVPTREDSSDAINLIPCKR
jgi:signal transduction histidine kinase